MQNSQEDPDWMYKPILNRVFSGKGIKFEQEVIGLPDDYDIYMEESYES